MAFHRAGDVERAERTYQEVLKRAPANGAAWYLRSVVAMGQEDYGRASHLLQHAVRHEPTNAVFLSNLGEAYRRLGRAGDAVAALERAVASNPSLPGVWFNLGLALGEERRFDEAIGAFETALAQEPGLPGIGLKIFRMFADMGREDLGVAAYRRLPAVAAGEPRLRVAVSDVLLRNLLPDEAIAELEGALAVHPDDARLRSSYGISLAERGELGAALEQHRLAVATSPGDPLVRGNYLFTLPYDGVATAESIRAETEKFETYAAELGDALYENEADPDRRLRVGYVSADFREHSVANFVRPLLSNHDRSAVEVICYSNAPRADAVTAEFQTIADAFHDIAGEDDAAVAERIRRDRIDVLVDLGMHTAHSRILVFARRPAPVQVTYLAYLGTTGLRAMDYRFTDPLLDPPGESDAHYTERSVRLPAYWCYAPGATPAVSVLPARRNGYVTFGSLNAFRKVNEETLSLWGAVIGAVPGSRMIVHAPPGVGVESVRRTLRERGVNPERVEFVGKQPRAAYFETYGRIDVCLDTMPYNGGTTTLDAYFMGVPVVTRVGRTAVGRAGAAIARHLGLPDVVARSDEEYVACATRLATDVERLASLRAELRQRLASSPLMDGPGLASAVENAYREMWCAWCDARPGAV